MNELVKITLIAHLNYIYPRTLEKQKAEGFKATIELLLSKLDQHDYKRVLSLPEVVHYVLLNTSNEYFGLKAGSKMALDLYKEICDNTLNRYETGYTNDTVIQRIL